MTIPCSDLFADKLDLDAIEDLSVFDDLLKTIAVRRFQYDALVGLLWHLSSKDPALRRSIEALLDQHVLALEPVAGHA